MSSSHSAVEALIRPMHAHDVPSAERLSAHVFYELDRREHQPGHPVPGLRPPARAAAWVTRTTHLLATDPAGCWVAETDGQVAGFAVSFTRELLWVLASYAVAPAIQGRGLGRALLEAALEHGRGCLRGMFCSSGHPAAFRRYRLAGFTLHPQLLLAGEVDRTALPVVRHVREGTPGDVDLMNSIDRRTRGAGHLGDHELMSRQWRLLVSDRPAGSGYAYLDTDGTPVLLAATQRRTAAALMWEALAASTPGAPIEVSHLTANNEWAIDVGLAARLAVHQRGYLAVRHMAPPAPYLPHGALL